MKTVLPEYSINKLLSNIPLFQGFDPETIEIIKDAARRENYQKNTLLVREGEKGDSLFVILSGMVRIYIQDEDGNEHTLHMSGPQQYFGEVALLDGKSRTASAVTTEATTVLRIPRSAFISSVRQNPDIALHIISSTTQRLRKATADIRALALKSTYQRLALKLMELSQEQNGTQSLERDYTHSDLATMIGASREAVSKILVDLEKQGYIERSGKQIVIKKTLPYKL